MLLNELTKNFTRLSIVLSYSFVFFLQILSLKDDNTELEEADFEVSDIFTMLAHFAPQKHFKLHTYACSSLSDKRIFMTPQGGADLVLEAVNTWKRCVTCAQEIFGATADPYKFDKTTKSCS